jgi:hypothetical protein
MGPNAKRCKSFTFSRHILKGEIDAWGEENAEKGKWGMKQWDVNY